MSFFYLACLFSCYCTDTHTQNHYKTDTGTGQKPDEIRNSNTVDITPLHVSNEFINVINICRHMHWWYRLKITTKSRFYKKFHTFNGTIGKPSMCQNLDQQPSFHLYESNGTISIIFTVLNLSKLFNLMHLQNSVILKEKKVPYLFTCILWASSRAMVLNMAW